MADLGIFFLSGLDQIRIRILIKNSNLLDIVLVEEKFCVYHQYWSRYADNNKKYSICMYAQCNILSESEVSAFFL